MPIPEPQVAVVEPLELTEDTRSVVEKHPGCLVSNERGLPSQVKHLRTIEGGAFVGLGSISSLLQLSAQWRERAILLDYDRDVVHLSRTLLDLVRTINEAPLVVSRSEIQRYEFLCALCLADVPSEAMERVAKLPISAQAKVKALFQLIQAAPYLTTGMAAEHLRPAVAALTRIYASTHAEGIPADVLQTLAAQARKSWRGTLSFQEHQQDHLNRFAVRLMRGRWNDYFLHLVVAPGDAEHLFPFSDTAWQRLAAMHGEGRIQVLQGDLAKADGAMARLARALREAGVSLSVFYASNAVQHFGGVPRNLHNFFTNMEAFPWAENATVIMTGTPRLLPGLPTKAQEADAAAGRDVFTYHVLRPDQLREAVWTR